MEACAGDSQSPPIRPCWPRRSRLSTRRRSRQARDPTPGPNYNVAPTTTISTVVKRHTEPDDASTRRVRLMRWGLVPPWAKAGADGGPDTKGPLLINARAEKLTSLAGVPHVGQTQALPGARWTAGTSGPAGRRAAKTPFYMYADDGDLLFMAGLWTTWRPKDAPKDTAPLMSCTIITTDSAGPLSDIHDRMPLTISASDWDRWLDPDAPIDEGLLRGHGDLDRIAIREVSTPGQQRPQQWPGTHRAGTRPTRTGHPALDFAPVGSAAEPTDLLIGAVIMPRPTVPARQRMRVARPA